MDPKDEVDAVVDDTESSHLSSEDENSELTKKTVKFTSEPPILKTVSGAYESATGEHNNNLDNAMEENSTIHRRFSALRPNFEPGTFGNLSTIPPPIPESLPTTPGFELGSGDMYFNRKNPLQFPEQQQMLSREQSTTNLMNLITQKSIEGPQLMTLKNPPNNLWRVLSTCLWSFAAGLSDGAPGAILYKIEDHYNISYSIVSMIWLSNAVGFIVIAAFSNKLDAKLGKRKMISGGCITLCLMYAIVSSGTVFPVICVGFFFGGLGLATCLSQMNIFLSRFDKASTYLGWFHGTYGVGATLAPILAASMVNAGVKWHFYYLILLGLTCVNGINLWFAYQGADEDLKPWDHQEVVHDGDNDEEILEDEIALNDLNTDYRDEHASRNQTNKNNLSLEPVIPKGDFKLAIKNFRTWLLTCFVFFYQGAEVSLPGWLETFLTEYRDGDPHKYGYVASGFWAGLTIGRLFLVERIHKRFGAKRGVSILAIGAIVFVALGWAINHIIIEAVLVSIAGVFVGPVYPLMITIATRVLPRKIQVISLTIMTSGGSSGGALWPFLTGLISQFSGAFVVMPMFIALFSAMFMLWFILPNPDRSTVKSPWQRLF